MVAFDEVLQDPQKVSYYLEYLSHRRGLDDGPLQHSGEAKLLFLLEVAQVGAS